VPPYYLRQTEQARRIRSDRTNYGPGE